MKKKNRFFYPAIFNYESGQGITVTLPDLKTSTNAFNEEDAFLSARELLGHTLLRFEENETEFPAPTPLSGLTLAENERSVLIDVYMPSVRLAGSNRAVCRTVTLPAWMNAAALEYNINFSHLLQNALKKQLKL